MAKTRAVTTPKKSRDRAATTERLAAGLHPGSIELHAGARYRVRLAVGGHVSAVLADEVEPAFADACLRGGRTVLLAQTPRGPTILGALQVSEGLNRVSESLTTLDAREIRIRAERALVLEAGPVSLRLESTGVARMEGERLVLDMASLVRILSAQVELP